MYVHSLFYSTLSLSPSPPPSPLPISLSLPSLPSPYLPLPLPPLPPLSLSPSQELLHRTDQLYHMAAVISLTMQEDDGASQKTVEYITQLEYENKHLRELLQFTQTGVLESAGDHGQPPLLSDSTPINSPSTASILAFPKNPPTASSPPGAALHSEIWTAAKRSARSDETSGVAAVTGSGAEYVHVATPLNSGQNTPLLMSDASPSQPLLEQARDKLTHTQT